MVNEMNYFVISDIHGMYKQFEHILTHWDKESTLVILGDLIDRGPQSLDVIRKVMALKEGFGEMVIFCKGNHEDMLLNYIDQPELNHERYFRNGGRETMASFFQQLPMNMEDNNEIEQAYIIKENYKEELDFLAGGELYKVVGDILFTHAGFDSANADFTSTTERDFIWVREHYLKENLTPYVNVFGHTPLQFIHESNEIWMSEDCKFVAIDGGCYFSGRLNALLISEHGEVLEKFFVEE
jgi:serine/threonine protein phosphatase 1